VKLDGFSVTGEGLVDERGIPDENGDLPVLQAADPTRKIRRYEGRESLGVAVRMNPALLSIAKDIPLIVCRLSPGEDLPPEARMSRDDRQREAGWIEKGLSFYWKLPDALEKAGVRACYLAGRFGPSARRLYYFVSEDPEGFCTVAERLARAKGFEFRGDATEMERVAQDFLPIELIDRLGLDSTTGGKRVKAGFGFTGAASSLERLQGELARHGYELDEVKPYLGELLMAKEVPVDGDGFLEELRTIVPLSRSLRCSYRGEETVDGGAQFYLTATLPERYVRPRKSMLSRFLGR
jgi:hypothetical protein